MRGKPALGSCLGWGLGFELCWGYIRVILGLYSEYIRVILGLYSGYIGAIFGLYWGYIRVILGLYWDNGKKMETTIIWGLRFRV